MDPRSILSTSEWTCGTLPARCAPITLQVIQQFDVARNPLFQPERDGAGHIVATFCNLFVSAATAALGCPIPHFVPIRFDLGVGAWLFRELSANATNDWLRLPSEGPKQGWKQVDITNARIQANAGRPTVASWKNPAPDGPGHIAMVLPSPEGGPLLIAQAGAQCLFNASISAGFGQLVSATQFFSHP